MALQLVGYTSGSGTGASYTVSLNGTLTGGIASSPSTGDIVVVVTAFANANNTTAPTVSGNNSGTYNDVHAAIRANDTWDVNYAVVYFIQGSSVDTSITATRVSDAAYGGGTIVQVWRGIDTATPIDVTPTTATGLNASRPDAPAITPITAGAVIIASGAGSQGPTGSAFTAPSNMTTAISGFANGSTSDIGVFSSYYTGWTSGSFNPNAATGGQTSTSSGWCASTFVLRPKVTHETTGTLTGQGSSVVGSANHSAKHTTTGTLAGQNSVISGSATNFTVYSTSGTLTGQGSVITGDADLEPMALPHESTGALVGQSSTLSGSATRYRQFSSSGVLSGQGSVIVGDADHEGQVVPHTTTGVLVGQSSVIDGTATRYRQFSASGTLEGQGAVVIGSANNFTVYDSSGVLTGQGSSVSGYADHESSFHDASGDLTGISSVITGNAKNESASTEIAGGAVTRRQSQPSLVIVEVDGKEYRVPYSQLNAFLNQIKQEAKADAKKPVKKVKKKRKIVEEAKQEIQIVVKSIPVNIIPEVSAKIQETNLLISNYYAKAMERYLNEMDDEEVLLMML